MVTVNQMCRLSVWSLPSQTDFSGEEGLSLLGPEKVQGLGLPLLPLVDPPQAQDVEQDGQHYDQDAEREQVVVVDKGGAQPAGVALPQCFLLQVPERQEAGFEQDGSQSPLDLFVINQLGCFQTSVIGGETETRVQHLEHPGRLEALILESVDVGLLREKLVVQTLFQF